MLSLCKGSSCQALKFFNHKQMGLRNALCLSFNPFYPLKCALGAEENELESVQCLSFPSAAITNNLHRRSEQQKRTKRSVLAVFSKIIVSPLDPFYFLLLSLQLVFPYIACAYLLWCFIFIFSLHLLSAPPFQPLFLSLVSLLVHN